MAKYFFTLLFAVFFTLNAAQANAHQDSPPPEWIPLAGWVGGSAAIGAGLNLGATGLVTMVAAPGTFETWDQGGRDVYSMKWTTFLMGIVLPIMGAGLDGMALTYELVSPDTYLKDDPLTYAELGLSSAAFGTGLAGLILGSYSGYIGLSADESFTPFLRVMSTVQLVQGAWLTLTGFFGIASASTRIIMRNLS